MSGRTSGDRSPKEYFGLEEIGDSPVERKLTELKWRSTKRRLFTLVGLVGVGVVFGLSLEVIGFSIGELITQWPQFLEALTMGESPYFPPGSFAIPFTGLSIPFVDVGEYWEFMVEENLIMQLESGGSLLGLGLVPPLFYEGVTIVPGAMFATLAVAVAGSVLGLPLALFFGVMSSERVVPYPFNFVFRGTMSLIRAIPGLVWFLILIPLAGVSTFTAALAIMVDTTGYLGRLFTDELEEISDGPIEGIRSTGASKTQIVPFGMLSQVFRQFIAWIAFDLEHNVRAAIGLGLIGGGGLGLELYTQRQLFRYTDMMACIILIFLLAGSVELASQRVRSYLREEEEAGSETGVVEAFVNVPRNILASTLGRRERP
ncbi:PhnE/PtxC family ABC transporter permease [Halosimplex pelagicum]|uniref:ABC transporter permease subunit n=1 Tax=Halosimplex pelagicum TaxID=869886 RepID=A0A7D5PCD0_9EURY|nr:ABC transporter permease subunit [Halosimplex pelagicum]QLH83125.1 ABC transporter permease subunit [Halosimplex pelagicum]